MEKSQRIAAQIYGYMICLVAVITLLITITTLVNAFFDLQDPLHAGWVQPGTPSLASYENYKMDILKSTPKGEENVSRGAYVPDEQTMKAMYEAAKADKIQRTVHAAHQSITISILLIVISVTLFLIHWNWMQRMRKTEN